MHLPKCEINPSVCFTIDLAQQFGLKVQTTHTDTHTHTQTHTHKAFTGKLTYPLSVLGCATMFCLSAGSAKHSMEASFTGSSSSRGGGSNNSYGNLAPTGTVEAAKVSAPVGAGTDACR